MELTVLLGLSRPNGHTDVLFGTPAAAESIFAGHRATFGDGFRTRRAGRGIRERRFRPRMGALRRGALSVLADPAADLRTRAGTPVRAGYQKDNSCLKPPERGTDGRPQPCSSICASSR